MIARGMTSRGKQVAALCGLALVLFLPKHVDCSYPGDTSCTRITGSFHLRCRAYEVEPLGFYLIELLADRDVGFAYTRGESCH